MIPSETRDAPRSRRHPWRLGAALIAAALLAAGCSSDGFDPPALDEDGQVEESDDALTGDASPANADRIVDCKLSELPAADKKATFRGKTIEYFSSDEIGYESDGWYEPTSPWISPEALDASVLGNPGYPSPNRGYAASVPANVRITVVDVRNVAGKLAYHYFSNETANSRIENWSSTKGLVMLQAGQTLRTESSGTHGLLATVFGGRPGAAAGGANPVGNWMGTYITEVARSSDNGTAAWLKSITGSAGSTAFLRNWLDSKADFGSLHGAAPRALGNRFKADDRGAEFTSNKAGSFAPAGSNTLMPIVMAEFWKRVAVNTADAATWLKKADYAKQVIADAAARKAAFFDPQQPFALTESDLKVLHYGYVNSTALGGLLLGATQHPDFVQAFGGKAKLDALTGGRWRIFGKTGSGSAARSAGPRSEAAFGGYVCIPADPSRAVLKEGRLVAFFINAQTTGSAGPARLRALRGVSTAMLPELTGAPSLWSNL